ncbi:MAG: putative toxin-antitoxin system toxin component, PIN family [Planctomycetes bacterium]|nr:putative toxin-antitoxin system toxin component, PIN family [Planctomycetota bacterium]
MRVFLDTNVLVSAFATRGLCSDVLRHVLAEHELVVGEVVLAELRRALRDKLGFPRAFVEEIDGYLRAFDVVRKPDRRADVKVRDPDDAWVVASAEAGRADVLVSGDKDLLDLGDASPVPIRSPRDFWRLARGSRS